MKKILILLLLLGTLQAKNYTYECSILAMFKDEADILPEWIEYHRLIGFEHFWLYNNNSKDNYLEVLKPYIAQGIVDLIEWPSPEGYWIDYQIRAYQNAFLRLKEKTKWVAIIDTDEFIVPVHGKNDLKKILRDFEKISDCGGITLYWLIFGTSHVYDIPEGKTLIETLLYRSNPSYPANYLVKTICRPERVQSPDVHVSTYNPPYRSYTINKRYHDPYGPQIGALDIDPVRIHHYWTRTEKYMLEVKCPRRTIFEGSPYSTEQLQMFEQYLNEELDDTILQFVPELKLRLKNI